MKKPASEFTCGLQGCDRPVTVMFYVVTDPTKFVPMCANCHLRQVLGLPIAKADETKFISVTKDQP
jgi:hypothetical protein